MRVASYNVHKCIGSDKRFSPERVARVIGEINADVVTLQEVDERFGKKGGLLDSDLLKKHAGMKIISQSNNPNGQGWHGNTVLVREFPKFYKRNRITLPGIEPRGAIIMELDLGEGSFRLVAVHLGLLRRCRYQQLGIILSNLAISAPLPTLVMGDMNEWRGYWQTPLKILEPMFGRAPHKPTFPARMPLFSLDRILSWPNNAIINLEVHSTPLARCTSDHLPIVAELKFNSATIDRTDLLKSA